LFELQPSFFFSSDGVPSSLSLDNLFCRLYRVIRSGCLGRPACLACCALVFAEGFDPGGGCGWKVIGGCKEQDMRLASELLFPFMGKIRRDNGAW
jgi:hypothetical protein